MIKVQYHGFLRQLVGKQAETLEVAKQSTLKDVLDIIQTQYGRQVADILWAADGRSLGDIIISIDGVATRDPETMLMGHREIQIAFIPAMAGGCEGTLGYLP